MAKMKGLSLPIETIVIVAVAVLVLVVVAAFFASGAGGGNLQIVRQQALSSACQILKSTYNCATDVALLTSINVKYQEIGETVAESHSLSFICQKLGLSVTPVESKIQCRQNCGCPA